MISFVDLRSEEREVPRTICRSDGTLPKDRRWPRLLGVIREVHLVKRLRNASDEIRTTMAE